MASSTPGHAHGDPLGYIINVLFPVSRTTVLFPSMTMFVFSIVRRCTSGCKVLLVIVTSRFVSSRLCCLARDGTNVTVRVIKNPGHLPDPRVQVRATRPLGPSAGFPGPPGASYQRSVGSPMQTIRPTYGAAPWEFDERATTKLLKIMYGAPSSATSREIINLPADWGHVSYF